MRTHCAMSTNSLSLAEINEEHVIRKTYYLLVCISGPLKGISLKRLTSDSVRTRYLLRKFL